MDLVGLFLKGKGRISQQAFWAGFGVLSAISVACLFVPKVGGLLWFATFFPWAMLNAKRLHDIGKSGWFQLVQHLVNLGLILVSLVLIGGASIATFRTDIKVNLDAALSVGAVAGFLMSGGIIAFNTLWLIWLGGAPGIPRENRWGRPTNWP